MEVKGLGLFEIRAYQNAVSAIDNLTMSVYDLWENNRLGEIPGVGAGLSQHLDELFTTGHCKKFDSLKQDLPQGMFKLIGIRGIGAKKAMKLSTAFKLTDRNTAIEKLKLAAEEHKIRVLESFGEKSEQDILNSISELKMTKNDKKRLFLYQAEEIAQRIKDHMNELGDVVEKIDALGSLRRRSGTVGDIDIAVATKDSPKVIDHFCKFPEIAEFLVKGDKKVSVNLKNDIQVDLRTSIPEAYGSMVQYFTGSKQHNVVLRTYSLGLGMSLSEYGIKEKNVTKEFATEEGFYEHLHLQCIPPEIRHGKDEVDLAKNRKIPELVRLEDIQGDLHTHTTDSDGVDSFEEMIAKAITMGYKYYGISDHAPSVQSRGHEEVKKLIWHKRDILDQFNKSQNNIRVFFGYEVNILADETLALPDEFLKELDYCVASIHTSFDQSRDKITARLITALENPYVTILGHPSGRLLNERAGCNVDWRKVFIAARDNNKIIEINSQPNRLDLADDLIKEALDYGVKLIINTDSHAIAQLNNMKYGIDVARRGWATKENIVNTLPLEEFKKHILQKHGF